LAFKGFALINLGRYNEALQVCDQAIKINPRLANAWSKEGIAFFYLGRALARNLVKSAFSTSLSRLIHENIDGVDGLGSQLGND
jgi:Flp pilus assembly protein TadD